MEKTVIDLSPVQARVATCKAIAWDTCHKIYVIMDDEQVSKMIEYGYEGDMLKASEHTPEILMNSILDWYANACDLVFIDAVSTNRIDPNLGFETLVGQSF
jgi:hypothetical protein